MKTLKQLFDEFAARHPGSETWDIADINKLGWDSEALVHLVASYGSPEDVEAVLSYGADPNLPGDMGYTPLHNIAGSAEDIERKIKIAEILLRHGADPTIRNELGSTPRDLAKIAGNPRMVQVIDQHMKSGAKTGAPWPHKYGP